MKKYMVILPNSVKIELMADEFVTSYSNLNIYLYIDDKCVGIVPVGSDIIEIFD